MSYENKGSIPATVFVTREPDRSGNYVCDGTADDVQIQAAIDYMGTLGGGMVSIGRGIYTVAATIVDNGYSDILIVGHGWDTVLTAANNLDAPIFTITSVNNWTFRDLYFDGNSAGQGVGNWNIIDIDTMSGLLVEKCYFHDADWNFIRADDIEESSIRFNHFEDSGQEGVELGGTSNFGVLIEGNYFEGAQGAPCISVGFVGGATTNDYIEVRDNIFYDMSFSIRFGDHHSYCTCQGNLMYASEDGAGVYGYVGDYVSVVGNIVIGQGGSAGNGIDWANSTNISWVDNIVHNIGGDGFATDGTYSIVIDGNISSHNGKNGITLPYGSAADRHAIISNNLVFNNSQVAAGTYHGINLANCEGVVIDGNLVYDDQGTHTQGYGIIANPGCSYCVIDGNYVFDTLKEGINVSGDYNVITSNLVRDTNRYGIQVGGGSVSNVVKNNVLTGNLLGVFNDFGTDTVLDAAVFQFTEPIVGVIVTTSPTGVEVDLDTEGALAWGQLPVGIQEVKRIKVWAVALDGPVNAGGQMHAEFILNAGASNAAYNEAAKSWALADHDSEEADYVANDVVHWVIEDGDVGDELLNLVAGDSFEIFAMHEAAADPDGATDALFRVVEVEYV